MNKLAKLPIFLGVVGACCAGVLAGINAITNPIIKQNEANKKAQAYLGVFNNAGYTIEASDIVTVTSEELSDDLYNHGCTGKAVVAKAKGVVYDFSATGYGGAFTFQLAFADGKYLGYTDISNNETGGYGKSVISGFDGAVKGQSAENELLDIAAYSTLISGRSITGKAIASAASYARADYMEYYNSVK